MRTKYAIKKYKTCSCCDGFGTTKNPVLRRFEEEIENMPMDKFENILDTIGLEEYERQWFLENGYNIYEEKKKQITTCWKCSGTGTIEEEIEIQNQQLIEVFKNLFTQERQEGNMLTVHDLLKEIKKVEQKNKQRRINS